VCKSIKSVSLKSLMTPMVVFCWGLSLASIQISTALCCACQVLVCLIKLSKNWVLATLLVKQPVLLVIGVVGTHVNTLISADSVSQENDESFVVSALKFDV